MGVQPIHPLDLVAATRDEGAIGDRPRHLHAEDYDSDWKQIPDSPVGAILVAASLLAGVVALVLL